MPLRGRVGRHARQGGTHCQNNPDDQRNVIVLLNALPAAAGGAAGALSTPVINGVCSEALYRAIRTFEDKQWPGQGSGYVDPGGTMLKRMEELAAATAKAAATAAGPVSFVMADFPEAPPTGATKVHATNNTVLTAHRWIYVGITGDRTGVVSVSDEPSTLTIEDVGLAAGGTRWFKLSRPRGEERDVVLKAKDGPGKVVASLKLGIVHVPKSRHAMDFDIEPRDPQRPDRINLTVSSPTRDDDWIDTRMEGIGYNIYLGGFQVHCTGMSTPIDVPYRLVDLNLYAAEAIDSTVYDTLAAANEAIRKAPARKGVTRFAYYRGAGGAVIAPTIFSPATSPRIIATFYEARRQYADYVTQALIGIAIGVAAGIVIRTVLGRIFRKLSEDPEPPRRALPAPTPARIRPVGGTVDVGGTGKNANCTALNPVKPGSGGAERNIPNHVPAPMEQMGEIFEPGSVQTLTGQRLLYKDFDWPAATRAAASVMPRGSRIEVFNVWTSSPQEVNALVKAFQDAGFEVNQSTSFLRTGPGTVIEGTRL